MTRKDFELIAETIKDFHADPKFCDAAMTDLATAFADALRRTNKQFNRDKFIRACGVTP